MECKFHVGQRIVCVNDRVGDFRVSGLSYLGDMHGLQAGEVYTVRAVGPSPNPNISYVVVWLKEIIRPQNLHGEEGFHPRRFRPLTDTRSRTTAQVEKLKLATLSPRKVES